MKPARIFLYIVATFTFLVVVAFFAMRIFADKLTELAFVPSHGYEAQQAFAPNVYDDPEMWFLRPGNQLARERPRLASGKPAPSAAGAGPIPRYAVFFVHPTTYLEKDHWNAPLDHAEANKRTRAFLKGLASPFALAGEIWAPRYRQAGVGAFLTQDPAADEALDTAYRDVELAFDHFVKHVPENEPIVLAGHSQGSMHLLRLLAGRIAGTPLQRRIAMVYVPGWPVSLRHDLPTLRLPACTRAAEAGCVMSWVSFAEPADIGQMLERYDTSPGLDGKKRAMSPILCTNPLTGRQGGAAAASANLGTLVPDEGLTGAELIPGAVSARCDRQGILMIGDPPDLGEGVLPGNNYHVYDIPLFWANLEADIARRMRIWAQDH